MITFEVDKVDIAEAKFSKWETVSRSEKYFKDLKNLSMSKGAEAFKLNSAGDIALVDTGSNALVRTLNKAYNDHIPLTLSPDDVWIAFAQGVANHIQKSPDDARRVLVDFEGKKKLEIEIPPVKGNPDYDWGKVFSAFGEKIGEFLGKKKDIFDPMFSTTGPVEKAVIQATMMASLQSFFEYHGSTMCGFPKITLLGEIDDWSSILSRVNMFGEFVPKWAHEPMQFVAAEFVKAAAGKPTTSFWKNFFKIDGMSGGPYVSGYINAFFPYILGYSRETKGKVLTENSYVKGYKDDMPPFLERMAEIRPRGHGPSLGSFPASIATVPMTWNYFGEMFNMTIASGFFGMAIDKTHHETGSVRPVLGWAIGEEDTK